MVYMVFCGLVSASSNFFILSLSDVGTVWYSAHILIVQVS